MSNNNNKNNHSCKFSGICYLSRFVDCWMLITILNIDLYTINVEGQGKKKEQCTKRGILKI